MFIDINNADNFYINGNQCSKVYFRGNEIWPFMKYYNEYFTIEPLENGTLSTTINIYYSDDNKTTWNFLSANTSLNLEFGKLYNIKSIYNGLEYWWSGQHYLYNITGNFNIFGNAMSLIHGDNFLNNTAMVGAAFYNMFINHVNLINAGNLIIPVNSSADACLASMFEGCTSLVTAPHLYSNVSWIYINHMGFHRMFAGCTSLITAPEIINNIVDMGDLAFGGMFQECTSLINPPSILPAVTNDQAYEYMFQGCTSLEIAPELPATDLSYKCYYNMFSNCTSLKNVKCLARNFYGNDCLTDWLANVSQTGTFIKDANTTWPTGDSGIPTGWTVINV